MKKRKGLYATLIGIKKPAVKNLQAYFYQGGKWHRVKKVKGTV